MALLILTGISLTQFGIAAAGGSVMVVNADTLTVESTLKLGSTPHGLGYNRLTQRVYVANKANNTVSVIASGTTISTPCNWSAYWSCWSCY